MRTHDAADQRHLLPSFRHRAAVAFGRPPGAPGSCTANGFITAQSRTSSVTFFPRRSPAIDAIVRMA
jgi:hypothetical protein